VDQFRDSVQMAVGTLGVERRLGVEVDHYYIHVLVKGGRGVFRNRGRESPGKRQYSHLCYAQVHSPNPPITQQTTWETKGLWIDKTPIWEAYFSQKPGDESNAEFWVDSISLEIKNESIAFIGPYTKQAHMIPQYLRSVEGEEKRWLARLWKLYDIEQKYGWKSKQFQDALDHEVPRSYQCNDLYGERCPYYRLCFKEPGWEDPIGTGEYAHRIPNHLAEKEQLERMLKG
jgi:hypothetical protein